MSMTYYSPSKLEAYSKCPKSFKETTFEDNDATKFGDAIHKSIEKYLLGEAHFMHVFPEYAGLSGLPSLSKELITKAETCFAALTGSSKLDINPDNIISIEANGIPDEMSVTYNFPSGKKKFFQVPMTATWGLRGSMDFVDLLDDGTLRIVDWKTGLSQPGDDMQLACYALAAWKIFPGFEKIQTGFFFLEQNGKYEYSNWNEHTLVGAFNYIAKIVQAMEKEHKWQPKLNKYCGYCTINSSCPLYAQSLKKPIVESEWNIEVKPENLPAIIAKHKEISSLKKIVEGIEKNLNEARKTILKDGPRVVGDKEFFLNEYASSYDYDVAGIFAEVETLTGKQPWEIYKLDSSAYDDFIAQFDDDNIKKALRKIKKEQGTAKSFSAKISERIAKSQSPLSGLEQTIDKKETKAESVTEPVEPEVEEPPQVNIINGGPLAGKTVTVLGDGMTSGTKKVLVEGDTQPVNIAPEALSEKRPEYTHIFVCANCTNKNLTNNPKLNVCASCKMEGTLLSAEDERDAMYKIAELTKRKKALKESAAAKEPQNIMDASK